jgi:hypothetical protein
LPPAGQHFHGRGVQVSLKTTVLEPGCFAEAVIFSISQCFMDQLELLYQEYL